MSESSAPITTVNNPTVNNPEPPIDNPASSSTVNSAAAILERLRNSKDSFYLASLKKVLASKAEFVPGGRVGNLLVVKDNESIPTEVCFPPISNAILFLQLLVCLMWNLQNIAF
jgi:hypothetical protein